MTTNTGDPNTELRTPSTSTDEMVEPVGSPITGLADHADALRRPLHGFRRIAPRQTFTARGPGSIGRVVAVPGAVAFLAPAALATHALIVEHLRIGGVGRAIVERAAELIADSNERAPGTTLTMAAIAGDADGLHLLVHGLEVHYVDGSGQPGVIVSGHGDPIIRTFASLASLSVGVRGEQLADVDPLDELHLGAVSAAGMVVTYDAHASPKPPTVQDDTPTFAGAPASPPAADPVAAAQWPVEPRVSGQPAPDSEPAPLTIAESSAPEGRPSQLGGRGPRRPVVPGLLCGRGHFNDPSGRFCARCGIALHQAGMALVEQERPPLGVLRFDNGEAFEVAGDLSIGRMPLDDSLITSGLARALILSGDVSGLSRVHASIHLDGWNVTLRDRASLNGTFLWDRHARQWARLGPDQVTPIRPGDMIGFGRRTASFEKSIHAG